MFFSLLKVHLQVRNFSVFIDVEKLEAGKFDNNLLQSIKQASNFILVLTPNALDRCLNDVECKDWVHRVSFYSDLIFNFSLPATIYYLNIGNIFLRTVSIRKSWPLSKINAKLFL